MPFRAHLCLWWNTHFAVSVIVPLQLLPPLPRQRCFCFHLVKLQLFCLPYCYCVLHTSIVIGIPFPFVAELDSSRTGGGGVLPDSWVFRRWTPETIQQPLLEDHPHHIRGHEFHHETFAEPFLAGRWSCNYLLIFLNLFSSPQDTSQPLKSSHTNLLGERRQLLQPLWFFLCLPSVTSHVFSFPLPILSSQLNS